MMQIEQYAIWWVDLDPTKGTETQKTRPCVILSNDILNQHGQRVIVAPLLKNHRPWPYVVNIQPSKTNGLDVPRRVDLTQIRAIDKLRLQSKKGALEPEYHKKVASAESAVLH
jgi:mRNA interferase MazF